VGGLLLMAQSPIPLREEKISCQNSDKTKINQIQKYNKHLLKIIAICPITIENKVTKVMKNITEVKNLSM
jgi:hypothetical protein